MTTISNETEWSAIATTSIGTPIAGNLDIIANFSFTSQQLPIYLSNTAVVNCNCHTVTFAYGDTYPNAITSSCSGMFILPTSGSGNAIVKNLTIDGTNRYVDGTQGFLTDSFIVNQFGDFENIHMINGYANGGSASFISNQFGSTNNSNISTITKCSSKINCISASGFCGQTYNVNFDTCFFKGVFLAIFCYGFVGFIAGSNTNTSYNNSYSSVDLIGVCAGFIGGIDDINNLNNTLTMNNCYFTGNGTDNSNFGFIKTCSTLDGNNNSINLNNCYSNFQTTDENNGGFIGVNLFSIITLTNCYNNTTYSTNNGSIAYQNDATIILNDCHTIISFIVNQNATFTPNSSATDLGFGTIYSWSGLTWTSHIADYPTLNNFEDTTIWDGTYILSSSTPNYKTCLLSCNCFVPCFAENTPVQTSNGIKLIQNLRKGDVLDGYEVEMVVKSLTSGRPMIKIEKDSVRKNLPSQDTFVTKQHLFEINGKQISAGDMSLLNPTKIYKVKPISEYVYHIILKNRQYAFITVNGLKAETLGLKFQEIMNKELNKLSILI